MDDARKKKIEEMVQAAAKAAPPATAPGRAALPAASVPSRQASALSAPSSSRDNTKAPLAPKNGTSGRVGAAAAAPKAAPAARRPGTSARGPSGSGGAVADDDEGSLSAGKLSKEELDEQMQALFGGAVVEQLRSAKWQERVEGMDAVSAAVRGLDDLHRQCSVLVQCVAHLPGFSDKNFQVGVGFGAPAHSAWLWRCSSHHVCTWMGTWQGWPTFCQEPYLQQIAMPQSRCWLPGPSCRC